MSFDFNKTYRSLRTPCHNTSGSITILQVNKAFEGKGQHYTPVHVQCEYRINDIPIQIFALSAIFYRLYYLNLLFTARIIPL